MLVSKSRKLRVFLCHASPDKPIVRAINKRLSMEGWIDPWLDELKLLPGQNWDFEIENAIQIADVVIVCISTKSVVREGYVQKELNKILEKALEKPEETIYIIPVRLDECEIPRAVKKWQYVDYFQGKHPDVTYRLLTESLRVRAAHVGIDLDRTYSQAWGNIQFCLVPKGEFFMGSKFTNALARDNEKPQHVLKIDYDYWTAQFPVTIEQFYELMGPKKFVGDNYEFVSKKDHPISKVSTKDIQDYLRILNETYGIKLPSGTIFRLPTEAEWEKAARGTDAREWPWGDEFDQTKCNSRESNKNNTSPVYASSPTGDSPYGISDMVGNVWELTHSSGMPYPYNSRDGREEKGLWRGVLRGGSFKHSRNRVRIPYRSYGYSEIFHTHVGFRVIVAPPLNKTY